jgi:hypothetical protein
MNSNYIIPNTQQGRVKRKGSTGVLPFLFVLNLIQQREIVVVCFDGSHLPMSEEGLD